MSVERARGFVPIAVTRRSGFDESVHFGAVVTIDRAGVVTALAGDPEVLVYPRSSNKPMQAAAMVALGLELPHDLLALVCASHDGSPLHVAGVRRLLAVAGLDESALGNTASLPSDPAAAEDVVRAGGGPNAIQMNCSGKHAGMVVTCVRNGWPVETYLDQQHPLQQAVTRTVERYAGGVAHVGVDGCGAPAHVCSLHGLATAFRELALERGAVWEAMTAEPVMVAGPKRTATLLMEHVDGLMAKGGADGVFAAALPDGRAFAMKVADGGARAVPAVALAALESLDVDVAAAARLVEQPVLGHGHPVGEVRSVVGEESA